MRELLRRNKLVSIACLNLKQKVQKQINCINYYGAPEMIDSYDFGRIIINGRQYATDLIVFPDRVKDAWWRKEGHNLHIKDLNEAIKDNPKVLIVGTGYSGLMKVPAETKEYVESKGIELIAQNTAEACKTFNRLVKSKKVVAALHITC
jgi:hypothetical protein